MGDVRWTQFWTSQGAAPDRLLRCSILKHLKGWSFRELGRELRCNLLYRRLEVVAAGLPEQQPQAD